ncbi:MAG: hypothetical protein HY040_01685 [Planctomycetes bacterium]|nr:hypothetical protein [Planctomycetota bacterium]
MTLARTPLVRWLCLLLVLAAPGALRAQSAPFTTVGLSALFGQESQSDAKKAKQVDVNFEIEISLPGFLCPGCPNLLRECITAWKECWEKGDYEAARHHASKAILVDPKNREAQRIHDLTRKLMVALTRFDVDWVAGSWWNACDGCSVQTCSAQECCEDDRYYPPPSCANSACCQADSACARFQAPAASCCAVKTCECSTPKTACCCANQKVTCCCATPKTCCCAAPKTTCCCAEKKCCCGEPAPKAKTACACGKTCACCSCGKGEKSVHMMVTPPQPMVWMHEQVVPCPMPAHMATSMPAAGHPGSIFMPYSKPATTLPPHMMHGAVIAVSPPVCGSGVCNEHQAIENAIRAKLQQRFPVSFTDVPLYQVVDDLSQLTKVHIVLNKTALKGAGVDLATPISFASDNTPLTAALKGMLKESGLVLVVSDGTLLITTMEDARRRARPSPQVLMPMTMQSNCSRTAPMHQVSGTCTAQGNVEVCTVSQREPAGTVQVTQVGDHLRLVGADMEALCLRFSTGQSADQVILEGDVRLTSKRGGQMVQLQAQRVIMNLKNGTFTVESAAVRTNTVQPVQHLEPADWRTDHPVRAIPSRPTTPTSPASRCPRECPDD